MARGALDIAIIGCGVAGMAAALFLARAGNRVRVFERFAAPRPIGSGLLLQPTGLAVLERLGLRAGVDAAGARIDRLRGRVMPSGRTILDVAYADLGPGLSGTGIHRAALFGALFTAVGATGIDVTADSAIEAIDPAADDRPVLVGAAGRRYGPFDLAIVATGAQSGLRAVIGTKRTARPFAYGALWTTLSLPEAGFDGTILTQRYAAARNMVGVLPVGSVPGRTGRQAAFFWSLRLDALEAWRKRGLAAWKNDVAAIWPEAAALIGRIESAEELQPAVYVHYTARHPVRGRLVLIGDAAHATSPQLGQGANMGLFDALALSDALAGEADPEIALANYAGARRRHVRFYQRASYWLTPLFQSDSRAAAAARDLAFPAMRALPYFRRETVRSLAGLKTGLFSSMKVPSSPAASE